MDHIFHLQAFKLLLHLLETLLPILPHPSPDLAKTLSSFSLPIRSPFFWKALLTCHVQVRCPCHMLPSQPAHPLPGYLLKYCNCPLICLLLPRFHDGRDRVCFIPPPSLCCLACNRCSINMNESKCQMGLDFKTNYKANLICSMLQTKIPPQISFMTTTTKISLRKITSQLLYIITLSKYITAWDHRPVGNLEAGDAGFSSNSAALAKSSSFSEPQQPHLLNEDTVTGLLERSNVIKCVKPQKEHMIHIRDTGDENSSATTELRRLFGIFTNLTSRCCLSQRAGSSRRKETKWMSRIKGIGWCWE